MDKRRIYLSPPHMGGGELERVAEAFRSNWIAPLGPSVEEFEGACARLAGVRHALAVSSGTAALHLAVRLLGITRGDEVICPTFTFCASAVPVIYEGGAPVFVDSERASWNMDPALLEEELEERARSGALPRAVIAVHLYGQCASMDPLLELCGRYRIPLIEDAAEAFGARYRDRPAGSMGYASFFSFNGNKLITTSGGGMLLSNDGDFVAQARFLSCQARDPLPYYHHSVIGYNYRMSNILAAIGLGQLRVAGERVRKKRYIFRKYLSFLGDIPGVSFMPEPEWSKSNRWLTCILIDPRRFGAAAEDARVALEQHDIESRPLWNPLHLQAAFSRYRRRVTGVAQELFGRGLCLPSGTAMDDEDIARVAGILQELHARSVRRNNVFPGAPEAEKT